MMPAGEHRLTGPPGHGGRRDWAPAQDPATTTHKLLVNTTTNETKCSGQVKAKKVEKPKIKKIEKPIPRRRRNPACAICDRPVMCGQGASHYECRPRCVNCGQPEGICLPGCLNSQLPEADSFNPVELGEEVGDRDDHDLAT
jgi:hypothetical protein